MTEPDDILDDLFHGCAFRAFLEQAVAHQTWPSPEATRQRAFTLYEAELAARRDGKAPPALPQHTAKENR